MPTMQEKVKKIYINMISKRTFIIFYDCRMYLQMEYAKRLLDDIIEDTL